MKKLIVLVLFPFLVNAQIKSIEKPNLLMIGKTGNFGWTKTLHQSTDKDTAVIYLGFRDAQYEAITEYKVVSFLDVDNTKEQFYNILASFFSDTNKKNKDYTQSFQLGDNYFYCSKPNKLVKVKTGNSFFYLSEKELKELFAKK